MTEKIHVTPGKMTVLQAKAGIVVISLFLVFGLAFGFIVLWEAPSSEVGMKILIGAFFSLWVAVCAALIVMFARIISKQKWSLVDVDIEKPHDFDSRLRKLEQLKREGLITEAEYRGKREQILQGKW